MLIAEKLSLTFGDTVALAEASATVGAGEVVALVGASGSGKSTMLHCMAGLLRPASGRVLFDGHEITNLDDDSRSDVRRSRFGFVFQFAELVPELTLRENIALPLELIGVKRKDRDARVEELVEALGLREHADRRAAQVSGGQAQRAAIARGIAHKPKVVFADEPTGALDSDNGKLVLDAFLALARHNGTAILLVTHDHTVAEWADRVLTMRDGRTVESS
ncbi:ABC transporter ATP-binding protein [Catellatospora sp. KI3]|uniref:ABC transporter ATP-binding protein n=1 Tax=Catellatospora sp. KI3 TaxID=3041620 RepID=UPI00248326F5|nr:ABC transporter ATP-binding protein [Catellatospora sp. KI3]MDI1460416.1 ABC transporter ATP-binding protein [Catellatospora sp. KI3]